MLYGFHDDQWEALVEMTRAILIQKARGPNENDARIFYGELVNRLSMHLTQLIQSNAGPPYDQDFLERFQRHIWPDSIAMRSLLERLSRDSHAAGNGMLSVVVVNADTGVPGSGFFELGRELYRYRCDDLEFLISEFRRVLDAGTCEGRVSRGAIYSMSACTKLGKLTAADFEAELERQFARAEGWGEAALEIQAGDLHRTVGRYPSPDHRMPLCCQVMKKVMRPGDAVLSEPPKGQGASLTIRYTLPR